MKKQSFIISLAAFTLFQAMMAINCYAAEKSSIIGYYELIVQQSEDGSSYEFVNPRNWTLKLILNTDGYYIIEEVERGSSQPETVGKYEINANEITFHKFFFGDKAIFNYTKINNLLTLKEINIISKPTDMPKLSWTFLLK